jgi:hypothetical protein
VSELVLSGFTEPDGTVAFEGDGVLGGDIVVRTRARLAVALAGDGGVRLEGTIATSPSGLPTAIALVRPAVVPPPAGPVLDLVLAFPDTGDAELSLPVSFAPSGVGATGPAEVVVDGVPARVDVGECVAAPSGRLRCLMPWDEGGERRHAWLAGLLGGSFQNQIYVGSPPLILRSGSWHLVPAATR